MNDRNTKNSISLAALSAAFNGDIDNLLVAATPGGIERQEAAGQCSFVASETLPKEMLHGCTREKLEQMGIKFGEDVDDLFVAVQLPDGWKKRATGHSMWSELLDQKGRQRAKIFYKAAFYDRRASISLSYRYTVNSYEACDKDGNAAEDGKHTHIKVVVLDCDQPVHVVGIYEDRDYSLGSELVKQAKAWLDQNHPDWRDPLAYWE